MLLFDKEVNIIYHQHRLLNITNVKKNKDLTFNERFQDFLKKT